MPTFFKELKLATDTSKKEQPVKQDENSVEAMPFRALKMPVYLKPSSPQRSKGELKFSGKFAMLIYIEFNLTS